MAKNPLHGSGSMTTQEIVQQSLARTDPGADWKIVYAYMYAGIKSNKFRILRCGNSLFFYKVESPIASNVHLCTTDKQDKLLLALREFFISLKICKFKKIVATVKDPTIIRLIRMAKSPYITIHQTPLPIGYKIELDIN